MSAVMKPSTVTSDALETLLSILRSMKNDGNIPAVDFCERLSHVQSGVSKLRALGRMEHPIFSNPPPGSHSINEEPINTNAEQSQTVPVDMGMQNVRGGGLNYDNVDILGNPLMDSFLDHNRGSWTDALFAEDGALKQFALDMEEQFGFQV